MEISKKYSIVSFITLILKRDNLSKLDECKSISLVGSLYKILSKVLSNKMKKMLYKVIDSKVPKIYHPLDRESKSFDDNKTL